MSGHLRRRGERSWELKYEAGADPLTGKRRIRYTSFKGTKRDAAIELARLIAEQAAGSGSIQPRRRSLNSWRLGWLTGQSRMSRH
jgi:integrase